MAKKKPTHKQTRNALRTPNRTRLIKGIREPLDLAVQSGAYLVASFYRLSDGRLHIDWTTHNFPTDAFMEAVRLLKQELDKQSGL